jgi:hypothetical protein
LQLELLGYEDRYTTPTLSILEQDYHAWTIINRKRKKKLPKLKK